MIGRPAVSWPTWDVSELGLQIPARGQAAVSGVSRRSGSSRQVIFWGGSRTFAIAFLLYLAGSTAGFALALPMHPQQGQIAVLWPPNAVLLCLLLIVPARRWPTILVAASLAHGMGQWFQGTPVWLMGVQFGHNCLLATASVGVIRLLCGPNRFSFDKLEQTVVFLAFAVAIVPAAAALIPTAVRVWAGLSQDFWPLWGRIALSNALSIAILSPALLVLCSVLLEQSPIFRPSLARVIEFSALAVALLLNGWIVFGGHPSNSLRIPALVYLPLPLLIWAALRFGPAGTSVALTVIAVLCIKSVLVGSGPLSMGSPEEDATAIQYFLLALCLPNICLAAVACERETAVRDARASEADARCQYVKLTSIYRNSPIGLAFIDKQLTFREVNEFLAESHGLSAAEHVGRSLDEVLSPAVAATAKVVCRQVMETGIPDINREIYCEPPGGESGSPRIWLVSHYPVREEKDVVGVNVFLQEITDRKRAESEINDNQRALRASLNRIEDLAGRLIQVQELERARIARELHDDVNQQLAALSIAIGGIKRRTPVNTVERKELESLQRRAIDLTAEIRSLSHGLHPGVLQHVGLPAAIRAFSNEMQQKHRLDITVEAEELEPAIPGDISLCLYRVLQEAIQNILHHAEATHVDVRLIADGDGYELTVADNGKGFDISSPAAARGLGLISMDERMRTVKGWLKIESRPKKGTTLRARAPRQ